MSARDDYEDEIEVFRKNRRLIRINNLNFCRTPNEFETAIKSHIPASDKAMFFWPPATDGKKYKGQGRHDGWVMLGFELLRDCNDALVMLRDKKHEVYGRVIGVARAFEAFYRPSSGDKRQAGTDGAVRQTAPSTSAINASNVTSDTPAGDVASDISSVATGSISATTDNPINPPLSASSVAAKTTLPATTTNSSGGMKWAGDDSDGSQDGSQDESDFEIQDRDEDD